MVHAVTANEVLALQTVELQQLSVVFLAGRGGGFLCPELVSAPCHILEIGSVSRPANIFGWASLQPQWPQWGRWWGTSLEESWHRSQPRGRRCAALGTFHLSAVPVAAVGCTLGSTRGGRQGPWGCGRSPSRWHTAAASLAAPESPHESWGETQTVSTATT